jgi:hypothetical protein
MICPIPKLTVQLGWVRHHARPGFRGHRAGAARQDHGSYRKDWQNEAAHCLDWRSTCLLPYIRNSASFVNAEQRWQLNVVK